MQKKIILFFYSANQTIISFNTKTKKLFLDGFV
jgi:hypothetical protein